MIPPAECTYAGRKRRKPVQKRRPAMGAEKSNPSKRHRDRLNTELEHLASLLPFPPDVISKLDKLSVLRLSVSYLRVKSFFQALRETRVWPADTLPSGEGPIRACPVQEGRLLLESLNGFALVVSAEGMIFYASATIMDYLGFHQTDVMHQNIYDYIHVDDRQDFCQQLHWAMDPLQATRTQPPLPETDDIMPGKLLRAQEDGAGVPPEYAAFLTRCFVCRVRCLLDSTSGFLTMQFQGKLKFLFGQKKKAPSGAALPARLSLFCTVMPVILPPVAEMRRGSTFLRVKHRSDTDPRSKAITNLCESERHRKPGFFAGRSNAENNMTEFRAHLDSGCWAQVLGRVPCLCFRGNSDFLLSPKRRAGNEEEGQERVPRASAKVTRQRERQGYSRHSDTAAPARHPSWVTEEPVREDSSRPRPEPGKKDLHSTHAVLHSSCVSGPGSQGVSSAAGLTTTFSDSLGSPLSAYGSQMNRPLRDVPQAQVYPSTRHVPQRCLGTRLPRSGVQCFMAGGFSTEGTGLPGLPMTPLLLEVPIKTEGDAGWQGAAGGCPPSRGWLGASGARRRLKTEPDGLPQACTQPPGHPHRRTPAGPCRELAPPYPAPRACQEQPTHHHLCMPGRREGQSPPLGCGCRAPGAGPVVKCEPLDSLSWPSLGRGAVPEVLPKVPLGHWPL
ncbi:PREDICTED: aryl hydrocarbon receptor repressor [Dipodomys ordii]|uniref:Aryl hydrocarbon receptor repressor n=1 Tax=Dipodomys ordii TaxID=10020 RepID=A0A1S3EZD0_DIPOR|nr:PREDICTED: aryl hydrocarbon receptor repressor [Dipodomys ordii]